MNNKNYLVLIRVISVVVPLLVAFLLFILLFQADAIFQAVY